MSMMKIDDGHDNDVDERMVRGWMWVDVLNVSLVSISPENLASEL
jgi:hypothetical protein